MKLQKDKVDDEIPTSSMADIAFLLIIYFMVTTTFAATKGLDFQLPEEDENPPLIEKEDSVLVEVLENGQYRVDNKPKQLDEIIPYLEPILERNPKKPVIIQPTPASAYKYMVAVLDELRQGKDRLGLKEEIRISIPTRREIESYWQ